MKNLYAIAAVLLLQSAALSQPPAVPRVPDEIASFVQPKQPSELPAKQPDPYDNAYNQSLRTGLPFVVFVNCDVGKVSGAIVASASEMNGSDKSRVVVTTSPTLAGSVLPSDASTADIRRAAGLEVSRLASPFARMLRSGEVPRTADDDGAAIGRWPKALPFPTEAVRYKPARFTQSIYTLNNSQAIDKIDRRQLKQEWQVPGAMEGVHGWQSDLYRFVPGGVKTWQERMPVKNSFGHYQYELGWTRRYPDGTFFVDALSNANGQPFEVRMREKIDGRWHSYIAWRNREARPEWYHGLMQTCQHCHSQAGSGEYGVGLVPGGDSVLSDPIEGLE